MWTLATLLHTCYYILQWNLNIPSIWQVICFETMLVIKVKSSISIYILFFSTKKTSQYTKLLVTSTWLCKIKIKNRGSSTLSQVAWMLRVWLFIRIWWTPVLWDVCIDLKGWNEGHYLFRWKNTKLCVLFNSDQTKKIPKNVLHVWLPELNCCISNIKW